ncbi:OmpA family protein [Nonomuraea sp. KC401]|nr:OmpA family protein [Nonomuraea sp. K271]NBE93963.1 OmpA family protein [Nonomuraea sp. K271]TLF80250.1 OmpA family protein [Nonomuraea sp. KC401]
MSAVAALTLGGCGLAGGNDEPAASGTPKPKQSTDSSSAPAAAFVKEGFVGSWSAHQNARVKIAELAAVDGMTRLTVEYTSLADRPIADVGKNDNAMSVQHFFRVLDPVQQLRYTPYEKIGSNIWDFYEEELWQPGVTYTLVAFLPPLKGSPQRVTVEGPGGIGEFAGVPVVQGKPQNYPSALPEERAEGWPRKGENVMVPVTTGEPDEEPVITKLISQVETVVGRRETDSDRETVALRADVLFAFDKADLSRHAKGVLGDVIKETRERADPDKPPITITGHTDGVGTDRYNQTLSEDRADAVRDLLATELGSDYEYKTRGKGSTDPVEAEGGDDDAWARSQNRRVEISYTFKKDVAAEPEPEDEPETETKTLTVNPADAAPPASFHPLTHAKPAAEATFDQKYFFSGNQEHSWKLQVYPFYRDGAYLVARFRTTHQGDDLPGNNPFGTEGSFEFSAFEPKTGTIYPQVYNGQDKSHVDRVGSRLWPAALASGSTQYGYFYIPAPPEETTELTFNGGGFGLLEGIPIEK